MGTDTIKAVAVPETLKMFDVLTILVFDVILIASVVPILWKTVGASLTLCFWAFLLHLH